MPVNPLWLTQSCNEILQNSSLTEWFLALCTFIQFLSSALQCLLNVSSLPQMCSMAEWFATFWTLVWLLYSVRIKVSTHNIDTTKWFVALCTLFTIFSRYELTTESPDGPRPWAPKSDKKALKKHLKKGFCPMLVMMLMLMLVLVIVLLKSFKQNSTNKKVKEIFLFKIVLNRAKVPNP